MEEEERLEKRPTVLLADDDQPFLSRVRELVELEFDVIGAVESGQAVLAAALNLRPDLFLLDISMPGMSGFQAARQLKKKQPEARILFLTIYEEPAAVAEALAIGVGGYVLKRSASADLLPAMRQVLQGGYFVSEPVRTANPC